MKLCLILLKSIAVNDFAYYVYLLRQFGFTKKQLNKDWVVVRKDDFTGYGSTELQAWGDIILRPNKLKRIIECYGDEK